jgi:uncharacterized membrane-anchored protein YitT (DUF2179 family)
MMGENIAKKIGNLFLSDKKLDTEKFKQQIKTATGPRDKKKGSKDAEIVDYILSTNKEEERLRTIIGITMIILLNIVIVSLILLYLNGIMEQSDPLVAIVIWAILCGCAGGIVALFYATSSRPDEDNHIERILNPPTKGK